LRLPTATWLRNNPLCVAFAVVVAAQSFDMVTTLLGVASFGTSLESNLLLRILLEQFNFTGLTVHSVGVIAVIYSILLICYGVFKLLKLRREILTFYMLSMGVALATPNFLAGSLNLLALWFRFEVYSHMPVQLALTTAYGMLVAAAWSYILITAFRVERCFTTAPPIEYDLKEAVPIVRQSRITRRIQVASLEGIKKVSQVLRKPLLVKNHDLFEGRRVFYVFDGFTEYYYECTEVSTSPKDETPSAFK